MKSLIICYGNDKLMVLKKIRKDLYNPRLKYIFLEITGFPALKYISTFLTNIWKSSMF